MRLGMLVCGQVLITFLFIINTSTSLMTGTQLSQKCHCDITSSFCDFGCCCDTDCVSSISEACFYRKSSFYCPKTDFFKTIKPGSAINGTTCYYFNTTITAINEKTLTNAQRTRLVSETVQLLPAPSSLNSGYKGYKMGTILTIGGKTAFSFVDNNGNCLTSAQSPNYNFRFGLNTKISCKCNNCGTPLLFSQILGKTLAKYLDISSNDLQLPSVDDSFISVLRINFIIGKYGSQKISYIDRITHSYDSSGSGTRTLYINFINSDNIKEMENSAPFFPQIPIDMFYPIHLMS